MVGGGFLSVAQVRKNMLHVKVVALVWCSFLMVELFVILVTWCNDNCWVGVTGWGCTSFSGWFTKSGDSKVTTFRKTKILEPPKLGGL